MDRKEMIYFVKTEVAHKIDSSQVLDIGLAVKAISKFRVKHPEVIKASMNVDKVDEYGHLFINGMDVGKVTTDTIHFKHTGIIGNVCTKNSCSHNYSNVSADYYESKILAMNECDYD